MDLKMDSRGKEDMNAMNRLDAMRTGLMQDMTWHINGGEPDGEEVWWQSGQQIEIAMICKIINTAIFS